VTLRLGYFPNVTHAPALVGIQNGIFDESLGSTVALEPAPFNAGPEAVEALFAGAIDATFIGPNPAINAYARSGGEAIRIVAGSTSGGAFLVVAPDITSAEELRGKTVASPQLGGTQDVALRSWLLDEGLKTDTAQGGDVSVAPQANPDTLTAFKNGEIAGAWVPEPWATRLVQEGGGEVLVDERDLWPQGRYVTTHLIVATDFLEAHPDVVRALIEGLVASVDAIAADPVAARASTNAGIAVVTDKPLPAEVIRGAWENLEFTVDPIAASLQKSAEDAVAVELLEPVDLTGIYDLTILNEVLTSLGRPEVEGL
jgi:NitT/TauT family transport system substrate-binding protein